MLGKGDHGHLAERACVSARAASGGGVCSAPSSVSAAPAPRRVGLTPFCAPPLAPAEPPSPFLHSQPSTPPLSKRVPGRRSRNRTISPHILHEGRAAVPTSVLKAEVVGGCGGRCGAGGERSANREGRRAASPASLGPDPALAPAQRRPRRRNGHLRSKAEGRTVV